MVSPEIAFDQWMISPVVLTCCHQGRRMTNMRRMNKRSVITPLWMMLFDSQSSFYSSSCPECRSKQISQIVKANTCMPTEPEVLKS
jgi:hypothetical protein